ncbi:MAG: hypothetical protein HC809_02610 [Gammaproteobacteria bacterium]|nr:hypothetical protein [Gammaproteobacteria bacterium]
MSKVVSLTDAYQNLVAATDLLAAARCLIDIGVAVGLPSPSVIDDYSTNRLLTAEDGQAMASVFGWEENFQSDWVDQKLYLVSPIAAVCRVTTKPFVWDAGAVAEAIRAARSRPPVNWHLTPERGIFGGLTVPIHLPRCRTGSVAWVARDPTVDINKVLAEHGDVLRLAGHRMMELVYASRDERPEDTLPSSSLSEREVECLTWASLGRTDVEIGTIIHRSPTTARFHIDNAIVKLGARNRTQAVAIASQLGLIHPLLDASID